jgi:predicted hydrolase (HD superfamily)
LLLVEKTMTQSDYDSWNKKFKEASFAISNREEKIDKVAIELEKDF